MSDILIAILRSGTPLIYVAMAGMLAQRAGIWHLGLEGLMIAGACAAAVGVEQTGSVAAGLALAVLVCVLGSALLWFVVEKLRANPIIAGLGLTGLGLGGTDLAVQSIYGSQASVMAGGGLPRLGEAFGLSACSPCWWWRCPSWSCFSGCCCAARGSACAWRPAANIPSPPAASASRPRACG